MSETVRTETIQTETREIPPPPALKYLFFLRFGLMLVLCVMYYLNNDVAQDGWRRDFVAISAVIMLALHVPYWSMRYREAVLAVVAVDAVLAGAYGFVFIESLFPNQLMFGNVGLFLFMLTDKNRTTAWGWLIVNVLYWPALVVFGLKVYGEVDFVNLIINLAFVIFASLVGLLIRSYQQARLQTAQLYEELGESHRQLRAYADQAESLAETRERIRIAREMHDTVGHAMTALIVQLQAARKVSEADPERGRELLLRCEELARSALQDVRLSVRAIRESRQAAAEPDYLERMMMDFAEATGMSIDLSSEGDVRTLKEAVSLTLMRTIQEGLTNARKHGQANEARIRIRYDEDELVFEITDNGKAPFDAGGVKPGFGLIAMRERVEEIGGTVNYGPVDKSGGSKEENNPRLGDVSFEEGSLQTGGFRIKVRLPHPYAAEPGTKQEEKS